MPTSPTRCFSLPPIGVGTGQAESLTSYLCRLASAHLVRPNLLLNRFFFVGQSRRPSLDGMAPSSAAYDVAAELTGRSDLWGTTLLRWREVLARPLHSRLLWCPDCYLEDMGSSTGCYNRLLWAVTSVTACPDHGEKLRSMCPWNGCGREQPPIHPLGRLGWCAYCKEALANGESNAAPRSHVERARAFASLVARSSTPGTATAKGYRENVHFLVEHLFGGSWNRASGELRVATETLGRGRNSGEVAVRLATRSTVDLADLLEGKPLSPQLQLLPTEVGRRSKVDISDSTMREHFEWARRQRVPPTFRAVAARLGIAPTTFRSRWPLETEAIVEAARAHRGGQRLLRETTLLTATTEAIEHLVAAKLPPTERAVAARLPQGAFKDPLIQRHYKTVIAQHLAGGLAA